MWNRNRSHKNIYTAALDDLNAQEPDAQIVAGTNLSRHPAVSLDFSSLPQITHMD
jgi:hypothetical protein